MFLALLIFQGMQTFNGGCCQMFHSFKIFRVKKGSWGAKLRDQLTRVLFKKHYMILFVS